MSTPLTFVVLGDSAAYGTGDIIKADRPLGWTYRIAEAIQSPLIYMNLARPGAKSTEIAEHQLPIATQLKPDIAVVVVGGNDMLRNNFCPIRLKNNLKEVFGRLTSQGTSIITLHLHDPSKILRLPSSLEKALMKRVSSVNRVYEELSQTYQLISIKAEEIDGVHEKRNWHVDMLHPGPRGHLLLAQAAIKELSRAGVKIKEVPFTEPPSLSRRKKIEWMLLKGTPWFFKRSFDLLPVALFLMSKEGLQSAIHRLRPPRVTLEDYATSSQEEERLPISHGR
jgi:lysophospholipase L1-like esterase